MAAEVLLGLAINDADVFVIKGANNLTMGEIDIVQVESFFLYRVVKQ
jgi:hypothetical protein